MILENIDYTYTMPAECTGMVHFVDDLQRKIIPRSEKRKKNKKKINQLEKNIQILMQDNISLRKSLSDLMLSQKVGSLLETSSSLDKISEVFKKADK